jgi:hypothetical protein
VIAIIAANSADEKGQQPVRSLQLQLLDVTQSRGIAPDVMSGQNISVSQERQLHVSSTINVGAPVSHIHDKLSLDATQRFFLSL